MESLYLKWKDYVNGSEYYLGALIRDRKNDMYYFKIDDKEINKAVMVGFNIASLPFMPNKIYKGKVLFSFFKIRVPKIEELSEEQLEKILNKYNMTEFDEFDYLRKTKGKIMTDSFILEEKK